MNRKIKNRRSPRNTDDSGEAREPEVKNQLDSSQTEIIRLRLEVDGIKKQLEDKGKGFYGWVKDNGALLALMAALIGLPRLVIDTRNAISTLLVKPEIYVTSPLYMHYDADKRALQFKFSVKNKGNEDALIERVDAKLQMPCLPSPSKTSEIHFSNPETFFLEKEKKRYTNVKSLKDDANELDCSIIFNLDTSADTMKIKGWRQLNAEFHERNGTQVLEFCFPFDGESEPKFPADGCETMRKLGCS